MMQACACWAHESRGGADSFHVFSEYESFLLLDRPIGRTRRIVVVFCVTPKL
jgi:hypothetical protein